jgi:hypothetical protein
MIPSKVCITWLEVAIEKGIKLEAISFYVVI